MKNILKFLLKPLPDKVHIQLQYFYHFHKFINLKNPKTFNEKLQWLKLYDKNPAYTIMVDKYGVKEYVADKIGGQHIIPTLGVWNNPEEIDFYKLPEQFVLKCVHDSKSVIVCKDKNNFDKKAAIVKLSKALKNNLYWYGREYPYKNVKPCVIAEKYMEDEKTKELRDYKFFCFNGKPVYCQVISDRSTNECVDFFDMEWNLQEFTGLHAYYPHPHYKYKIEKPVSFEQMKQACVILAKNIPFVRADFYEINGKMYFGELTFFPASGFGQFYPDEWNKKTGDLLILPEK